mmetsp:Transcript_4239/g.6951  ORF Transcript_4239/g.6951 Transcript_4239/m.6951 type:complete len:171 (-) Transcript_4239:1896-2408(-)
MNVISGFASIYFEQMLKKQGEKITIWERNFQLAFCSIWLLLLVMMYDIYNQLWFPENYNAAAADAGSSVSRTSASFLSELSMFQGWTVNTVLIAFIQASGGLLVAATLKYADSILKTLATSGSIVLSAILGYLLLGGALDIFIIIGCICTILAICNYTFDVTIAPSTRTN